MEDRRMRAVVFDLDGTLVDSAPDIVASANTLLASKGFPPLETALIRSFIGNGVPKLVERVMRASKVGADPSVFADWVAVFTNIYAANPVAHSALYPGVFDLLTFLRDQGVALGVCTNKNFGLTVPVLDGLSIRPFFGSVVGGDSLVVKKPDPQPLLHCIRELEADDVVYVGDSEVDAATAQAADLPFALFTEGYRKSPVAVIPHQSTFSDFRQAKDVILALFERAAV